MASNFELIKELCVADIDGLQKAQQTYGDSWRVRGGVGSFMMLARKWDRIENQCSKYHYDVFKTIEDDPSSDGILDDIQDLRRYLLLVESHVKTIMAKQSEEPKE